MRGPRRSRGGRLDVEIPPSSYVLVEMIIERVTGTSYQDQLYRRIIDPLCLRDLHYRPDVIPPG